MYSQGLVVIHDKSYNNIFFLIKRFYWIGKKMSLRVIIEDKYINAVKVKNIIETNTLRLIKSAIKDKDIAFRSKNNSEGINDSEIFSLLQNLIKQRKDSIESFKIAKRNDLIKIELNEIEIISQFLPQQLNEFETEELIDQIILTNNLSTLKDMGILMNNIKKNNGGSVDMALVGKIAKSKLSK